MIRSRSTRSQDLRPAVVDILTICAPVIVASMYSGQEGNGDGEKYNAWLASLSGYFKLELDAFTEEFSRALERDGARQAFASLVTGDVGGVRGLVSLIVAPEINAENARPSFTDIYDEVTNFFSDAGPSRANVLNVIFHNRGVLEKANVNWLMYLLDTSPIAQPTESPAESDLLMLSQESDTPTEIAESADDRLLSPLSILGVMRQTSGELRAQELSMVELVRSHSGGSVHSPQDWFGAGVDIDDIEYTMPPRISELLRHADALLSLVMNKRLFSSADALQFRVIRQEDLADISIQSRVFYFYHEPELADDNLQVRFYAGDGDVPSMQEAMQKIATFLNPRFATVDSHGALMLADKSMQGISLSEIKQSELSRILSPKNNYILPENDKLLGYVWTIMKYKCSMYTWFCPTLVNAAVSYALFKIVVMRERPYEDSNIIIDYNLQGDPQGAGTSFANSVTTFFAEKVPGQSIRIENRTGKVRLSLENPHSHFTAIYGLYKSGGYKASQVLAQQIQMAQDELARQRNSSSSSHKRARVGGHGTG
jgi:hypothetical protein